jgi:peptidoglycan hydrolase CwlO-like protein
VDYIHRQADTFAMAVAVKEMEKPVQDSERIARLESHVEHIQSDVTDLRIDVRKLSEKVDTEVRKLNEKIDTEVRKLHEKIDAVKDIVSDLKMQMETRFAKLDASRALDKVWWLLSMASLLAVMARGFKWI